MAEKKVYGLIMPKKKGQLKNTPVTSMTHNVFGDDSDEEEKKPTTVVGPFGQTQTNNKMKRQTQMDIDKALQENPDIYEYDNIYDDMQASKPKIGVKEKEKSVKERMPKYISNLLKAAEVKKKEEERRKERQVQKEREAEGAQYADKESFVTGAYKKKMLEMQAEEEEEKRKAQIDDMTEVTKQKDMSGFYRYLYKATTGDVKDVKPDVTAALKDEPDKSESANKEPTIKEEPKSPCKDDTLQSGSDSDSEKDKSKPDGTFAKRTKGNNFRKRHASSSDSDSTPAGREAKRSVPGDKKSNNPRQPSPSHRSRHSPQLHRRKRSRSKSPAQRRKRTRSRSKSPARRNKKSSSKSPSYKQQGSSPNFKSQSRQKQKPLSKSFEPEDRDRSVSPTELSSNLVKNGNEENQPISDGNIQTNLKEIRKVSGTGPKTVKIDPAKKVYPHHNSKKDVEEAKKRYLIRKIAREQAKVA